LEIQSRFGRLLPLSAFSASSQQFISSDGNDIISTLLQHISITFISLESTLLSAGDYITSLSSSWAGTSTPDITKNSVLYVHHYLPALYFAILVEGFVFDHFTRNLNPTTKWGVFAIAYIAVAGTFIHFRDISFGMEGDASQWKHLNWLPKWRIADRGPEDEE
jgi:dolichyl-phosphate-mannose--protein O-mannosyl transferase